jgi:hypothetical protein
LIVKHYKHFVRGNKKNMDAVSAGFYSLNIGTWVPMPLRASLYVWVSSVVVLYISTGISTDRSPIQGPHKYNSWTQKTGRLDHIAWCTTRESDQITGDGLSREVVKTFLLTFLLCAGARSSGGNVKASVRTLRFAAGVEGRGNAPHNLLVGKLNLDAVCFGYNIKLCGNVKQLSIKLSESASGSI